MQRKDKTMDGLKHFMRGYLNISMYFELLDEYVCDFKCLEEKETQDKLIKDLEDIMNKAKYEEAKMLMYECDQNFSKRFTEEFIRYLYARMKNKKPHLTLEQLRKIR
jgi:hypothetical protein